MKTITLFTAFIFLFTVFASAQEEGVLKKGDTRQNVNSEIIYSPLEDPVPLNDLLDGGGGFNNYFYYGDPTGMFLNPEWLKGSALLVDGTVLEGSFRYNIYFQKIQAILKGDTFAFAKPSELEWVQIGEKKFIFTTFMRNNYEVDNAWFEVLCEGECDLLLRRYIKYRVTDGDDDITNDQLYKLDEYYVRKDEKAGERMYITKKAVLSAIHEHESEISAFIKSHKLKIKEQEDLVSLFAYYNTLD